jgi:SAM-dependent methyltransferase
MQEIMGLTNLKLRQVYERGYGNNIDQSSFPPNDERKAIIDSLGSWEELSVLELGCGMGQLANMIALHGAKSVYAVDYSESAINKAQQTHIDNVIFEVKELHEIDGKFDVIVMQGVLEHLDNPYESLGSIADRNLAETGCIITSSPNFLNPRGYVWMTVYYMIRIHMAAVDLNFIYPWDMSNWANNNGFTVSYKSCDQDWGSGKKMLRDFNNRLRNAIFNKHLRITPEVDDFLKFLGKAGECFTWNELSGANIVYKLQRQKIDYESIVNSGSCHD